MRAWIAVVIFAVGMLIGAGPFGAWLAHQTNPPVAAVMNPPHTGGHNPPKADPDPMPYWCWIMLNGHPGGTCYVNDHDRGDPDTYTNW